ncbi:thiolase family protein [Arthrobacter sp. MI7-26]|uniref:thiolase family protein n=1 Tax=Arthrobacter sp. MI7-26 TaxID=2993653 RepID=UPI002248E3D1|nr:thiolase family protein [Arthrobacter sp. MI7-26]MCX2746844.1 thiolase family protein [Arthrobacter sp. MI7-26]
MSDPQLVWIVDGIRSPFGRFGGGLREVSVVDLARQTLQAVVQRTAWPVQDVSELNAGMAMIEGGLMVPARQYAMAAGFPETLPSLTVDRACCSGMTTVGLGWRAIQSGARSTIALGIESMSQTPRLLHETRWGSKRGDLTVEDLLMLRNPLAGGGSIARSAGEEAVNRGVGREEQDAWALQSHERYFKALADGYFDDEITPVSTPGGDLRLDEQPRSDSSLEKLARLEPVYGGPTVTAGNAPGLNDGAVALILSGSAALADNGATPLAKVHSHLQIAGTPTSSVYLPGLAIARILQNAGLTPRDLDVIEINEAFAATAVVSIKTLADGDAGLEEQLAARTNMNGGAVAIGHATGASGARLVLTAARQLKRIGGRWAVAAICGGFGQTDAILIEAAQ